MAGQIPREEDENDLLNEGFGNFDNFGNVPPQPTRSLYSLTRKEITRGIANRFVHSRTYIILYLTMAALSIITVALSLGSGCPPRAFYVLEFVINSAMILEVSIRLVAFGNRFWKSPFNIMDLILTIFCAVTIFAITLVGCGSGSKAEELFDTLLLVARNILQFARLAIVMRQSGRSIFSQPRPIDLSAAASRRLDIDIEEEEADWGANGAYRRIPEEVMPEQTGPDNVVFDASSHIQSIWRTTSNDGGDNEDTWARSG